MAAKGRKKRASPATDETAKPSFSVRWTGTTVLLEVSFGESGLFSIDREKVRKWLAELIRQNYLASWNAEDASVTSGHVSDKALNFFEDRLQRAIYISLNALARGAIVKALDDWRGQVITVSAESWLTVPSLDDLKSKDRNSILERVERAWREVLDFRSKGGQYPDGSKEQRHVEVFEFWNVTFRELIDAGVDEPDARQRANAKTMRQFKIKTYSTLRAWRNAGRKLSRTTQPKPR